MKVQVTSSYNGLVQQVDIDTAGCFGLCPDDTETPPPDDCEGGFLMVDGVFDGPEGHIERFPQLGSEFGAAEPVASTFVLGYVTASPGPACNIEPPGLDTLSIELLFGGEEVSTVSVLYDTATGFYFLTFPENSSLPDPNGCVSFGEGSCNVVEA